MCLEEGRARDVLVEERKEEEVCTPSALPS